MAEDREEVINLLTELQSQRALSISKLSEPLLSASQGTTTDQDGKRNSDASSTADDNPTPASLEADLQHYKDLFTKLRFSYVEQVTKEKFLRAVVGDPPLYVEAFENSALEAQLLDVKAQLKQQKAEVAELVEELEGRGRDLSRRYHKVHADTTKLKELHYEIEQLRPTVESLREAQSGQEGNDPLMMMPLNKTLEMLEERRTELEHLESTLTLHDGALEDRQKELGRLEAELKSLDAQKANAVAAANEARRSKEEGGGMDDELEQRGRWLQGVHATLLNLLEVES